MQVISIYIIAATYNKHLSTENVFIQSEESYVLINFEICKSRMYWHT